MIVFLFSLSSKLTLKYFWILDNFYNHMAIIIYIVLSIYPHLICKKYFEINFTACQCFNHADRCEYNEEIAKLRLSLTPDGLYEGGGVCVDCKVGHIQIGLT